MEIWKAWLLVKMVINLFIMGLRTRFVMIHMVIKVVHHAIILPIIVLMEIFV